MLGDSFLRHIIDLFGVFIQAEQRLFQCVISEFALSHGWFVVTSAVCCSDLFFTQLITWSGAKLLPGFSFVSGHQGLHDQGEQREGIRMLMANILLQCTGGSSVVHRNTICCHAFRLYETIKNNDCLRSE